MLIHNRLKKIREKRGMKQSEVCHGIVSASHYSNIEACRFTPSIDTMMLIAERLDVPYTYLANTNSYNAKLEEILVEYEKLIDLRDLKGIEQLLSESDLSFKFIESISQEYHFNLLKFLELIMSNKVEDAVDHYEDNLLDFDTTSLNYIVYKKHLYASGLYNYYKRNYKESIRFYLKTIDLDKSFKSRLFYNISLCFYEQDLFSNALTYAKSSTEMYLKEHKWERVADCYNLIAVIYREMGDLNRSDKYIKRGFDIVDENSIGIKSKLFHNLSLVKKNQGDIESALYYTRKAIALKTSINANDIFISYRILLNIHLENQDILNLKSTLKMAESYAVTQLELGLVKFFAAQLNWLKGNNQQYEILISEAIKLFLDNEIWTCLQEATEHYSLFLENIYKYKKALEQQKLCSFALKNINGGKQL